MLNTGLRFKNTGILFTKTCFLNLQLLTYRVHPNSVRSHFLTAEENITDIYGKKKQVNICIYT